MEWEYLTGRWIFPTRGDERPYVILIDPPTTTQVKISLNKLGMNRWELMSTVSHQDDLIMFFKRQKLYAVGQDWYAEAEQR